jgi:hypothetical protein
MKISTNCPFTPKQSIGLIKKHIKSSTFDPGQWSSTIGDQKDQDMAEPPKFPSRSKSKIRTNVEQPPNGDTTPNIKLSFGIPGLANPQALALEASANPFTSPGEGNRGAELRNKLHEDAMEGWSFQGRRRHAPKLASPRQELHQPLPHTPQLEITLGGKEGNCTPRYTPPSSPPLTSLSHQTENSLEPECGQSWSGRRTPKRRRLCTPRTKPD